MGMKQWWNYNLQGKIKETLEKILLHCWFIHHKFHVKLYGIKLKALQ
jgi:hypothetical protein